MILSIDHIKNKACLTLNPDSLNVFIASVRIASSGHMIPRNRYKRVRFEVAVDFYPWIICDHKDLLLNALHPWLYNLIFLQHQTISFFNRQHIIWDIFNNFNNSTSSINYVGVLSLDCSCIPVFYLVMVVSLLNSSCTHSISFSLSHTYLYITYLVYLP